MMLDFGAERNDLVVMDDGIAGFGFILFPWALGDEEDGIGGGVNLLAWLRVTTVGGLICWSSEERFFLGAGGEQEETSGVSTETGRVGETGDSVGEVKFGSVLEIRDDRLITGIVSSTIITLVGGKFGTPTTFAEPRV